MSLKNQFDLVAAAGFQAIAMDPMALYRLAGKIIQDEPLRLLCMPFVEKGVLRVGTRAKVLGLMEEADRQALRIRVSQGAL